MVPMMEGIMMDGCLQEYLPAYNHYTTSSKTIGAPTVAIVEVDDKDQLNPEALDFEIKKGAVHRFMEHLTSVRGDLTFELATYQSYAATHDEFERIFECFESLDEIRHYLTRRTGTVAVFFPLNLPLYALCLYGIIPSLVSDQIYIRAPQRMTTLIQKILPLLQVERFFPNIAIAFVDREDFVKTYVTRADVTIFTGKLSNAQHVMAQTKKDSLFLFNGWGCNPIVLGQGADLDFASTKAVDARLFCSGQDCAAPDTILVHRDHVADFVDQLKTKLEEVKIGDYHDPEVRVGKLTDHGQIHLISALLLKFNDNIVYGGCIDYQASIIHPTVIVAPLSEKLNYEELFAPVFIISVYDDDASLALYFEHPQYIENEMYISLFGTSPYVSSMKRSIVIKDKTVFDTDRGNDEFGGHSIGASFVSTNRNIVPKPVLVPRDIYEFLDTERGHKKLAPGTQKKIGKRVSQCMRDTFGSNLVFGFSFGSIADGTASLKSDINTMIVVKEKESGQIREYLEWLAAYHVRMKLVMNKALPAEIFSFEELEQLVLLMEGVNETCKSTASQSVAWIDALLGAQRGVAGDKTLAIQYRHRIQAVLRTFTGGEQSGKVVGAHTKNVA